MTGIFLRFVSIYVLTLDLVNFQISTALLTFMKESYATAGEIPSVDGPNKKEFNYIPNQASNTFVKTLSVGIQQDQNYSNRYAPGEKIAGKSVLNLAQMPKDNKEKE
jgi:hypothetical protein